MASLIRRVQDLIVENGEVKGQTQADWVGWCKIGLCNFSGVLVSLEGLVGRFLSLVANGELSKVTVVITLPIILLVNGNEKVGVIQRTSYGRRPWTLHS